MESKHDKRQRGRDGKFQKSRGKTYGESIRSNNVTQDKGKIEWKEPVGKRGNYTIGSYTGYSKNNSGGKGEERSWFKSTCFKCGGHRTFEYINFGKKI